MPIYEKAPAEAVEMVARMMERYHGPLRDAGVTVNLLFAHAKEDENEDKSAPALKLRGVQVAALVSIHNYKQRVQGLADAEIIFDGDRWDEWSPATKEALCDHELEHLTLVTDKDGNVKRDDIERPRLRMRLHDHEFGWFDAIARRHGNSAFEVQQAKQFVNETYQQQWLSFMDSPDSTSEPEAKPPTKGSGTVSVSIRGAKPVTMSVDAFVGEVSKSFDGRGKRQRAASRG